jgi:hypothetical protein
VPFVVVLFLHMLWKSYEYDFKLMNNKRIIESDLLKIFCSNKIFWFVKYSNIENQEVIYCNYTYIDIHTKKLNPSCIVYIVIEIMMYATIYY